MLLALTRVELFARGSELKKLAVELARKRDPEAVALFKQADALYLQLEEANERIDVLKQIGHFYRSHQDDLTARRFYEEAYSLLSNTSPERLWESILRNLKDNLFQLKDWPAARRILHLILTRSGPNHRSTLFGLAHVAVQEGDYDTARLYYSRIAFQASQAGNGDSGAFASWGRLEYQQGNFREAASLYRLALLASLADIEMIVGMRSQMYSDNYWDNFSSLSGMAPDQGDLQSGQSTSSRHIGAWLA